MSYKITRKKFLSFIMALLIALSLTVIQVGAVSEEEPPEQIQNTNAGIGTVSPLWLNINDPKLTLTFLNNKIYARVNMTGVAGTKYKDGTVTISKYSGGKYVPIKKWTGLSSASTVFYFSNSELSATSGVKYKLSITITAYTSTKSEIVKTSKVATCP